MKLVCDLYVFIGMIYGDIIRHIRNNGSSWAFHRFLEFLNGSIHLTVVLHASSFVESMHFPRTHILHVGNVHCA